MGVYMLLQEKARDIACAAKEHLANRHKCDTMKKIFQEARYGNDPGYLR